jgi:hypothetical protein
MSRHKYKPKLVWVTEIIQVYRGKKLLRPIKDPYVKKITWFKNFGIYKQKNMYWTYTYKRVKKTRKTDMLALQLIDNFMLSDDGFKKLWTSYCIIQNKKNI